MYSNLQIKNFCVKSFNVDHLDLFWEIGDTWEDPSDHSFIIERSESPLGPWDQISEPFSDRYHYRDITAHCLHKWRQLWYRIKIIRKNDDTVTYTESVTKAAKPDLVASEVRRLELILFREHIGRKVWLFPVRTFGQKCPDCWDPVTRRALSSNCITCYSTTYVRGYLSPIQTYMQVDPSPKHIETLQVAETQQQNTTARLPYFPPLKPRDILIESENRRWRVVRVGSTQRLRSVLHYEVGLHEIPHTDIEYRLPVNIDDLQSLEASPGREFTNPHNMENYGTDNWFHNMLIGHGYSE